MIRARDSWDDSSGNTEPLCGGVPGRAASCLELAVVDSVNHSALETWAELFEELKPGVTTTGMVLPQMERGFTPPCGWAEFLEKFWQLKHYLEYVSRYCHSADATRT